MLTRFRFLVLATVLLAGCRAFGDDGQSYFGEECASDITIYGCVDIRGTVTNGSGAGFADIDVGPAPGTDTHGLKVTFTNTGADGKYELRLFQLDPNAPESFELSLKATLRNNAGTEVNSRTISVQVTVSDLDEIPDPVVANFVIQ